MRQRADDRQPLLLAAGQAADELIARHLPTRQQAFDLGLFSARIEAAKVGQQLRGRARREEIGLLRHGADARPAGIVELRHRLAEQRDATLLGLAQAEQSFEQAGLAGALQPSRPNTWPGSICQLSASSTRVFL